MLSRRFVARLGNPADRASAQPSSTAPKRLVISLISEPTGFNLAVETARLSITQAGLAYFLVNHLLVHAAVALHERIPLRRALRSDLAYQMLAQFSA